MAANKLEFVPIELSSMKDMLAGVVSDLQQKDAAEVDLYLEKGQSRFDCVYAVLQECLSKFFVVYNKDVIGIVAHKDVFEKGYRIAVLCILTTNKVKKYHKQYYIAAKKFISSVAKNYDVLVCEIIDNYHESIKMASKLGFVNFVEREIKGKKLLVHMLRVSHGMD